MASITGVVDEAMAKITLTFSFTDPLIDVARIWRVGVNDSIATTIRGGDAFAFFAGAEISFDDFEVPLDTWVYYRISGGDEEATSGWLAVASGGYSWLKDPGYPSRSLRLDEVTSIAELTRTSRAGVFNILDRPEPVVVAARRSAATGELVCHTSTTAQRQAMLDLLSRGQVLLLSTPAGYGFGNCYVHVGDAKEARVGLAMEQTREWTLPLTIVQRPLGLATQPLGMRWADVVYTYTAWSDLLATGMTWAQLLEASP